MSPRRLLLALAVAGLASASAAQKARLPGVPDAARPQYAHSEGGFRHFVADELAPLVVGEAFAWEGRRYEVVKLHSIVRQDLDRWTRAHANEAVAVRGRVVAIVHVRVDGRLQRARVEGIADNVSLPEGWRWRQMLLYLGANESYDFVTGETG